MKSYPKSNLNLCNILYKLCSAMSYSLKFLISALTGILTNPAYTLRKKKEKDHIFHNCKCETMLGFLV